MAPLAWQPKLKSLKWLMFLSPVFAILSLPLLLWVYGPPRTGYLQAMQNPATLPPGPVRPQQTGPVPSQQTGPVPSQQPGPVPPQQTGPVPQEPGSGPHAEKVPLVAVKGTHTLLLSAYMDHRTQKVRVIAVAKRTEAVDYRCIFLCQSKGEWIWNKERAMPTTSAPQQRRYHFSVGDSSFHPHFGFEYGTVDILCPLPPSCGSPLHVAVTSTGKDGEHRPVFLEVLNRQMRNDSFPHNFTVCFSTMFNWNNVLQLVQSIEMLRLLGVSRVVIYRSSCSPHTQRILDYYTHTGLVEVIPWSMSSVLNVSAGWNADLSPGQMHYYGQIPALNDCVYRYMYQTQYIALHDIDELILPQQVDSWPELLPLLEQKHGADFGYMFENNVFPKTVASGGPQWRGVSGVDILAHLLHEPPIDHTRSFNNFKIIVNPRVVFRATVHGLKVSKKDCVWVDNAMAKLYHTRSPEQTGLTADKLVFDGRLLLYSTRLIPAVNTVLRQTGLIPLVFKIQGQISSVDESQKIELN